MGNTKDVLIRHETNSSTKISSNMEEEVKPTGVETEEEPTAVETKDKIKDKTPTIPPEQPDTHNDGETSEALKMTLMHKNLKTKRESLNIRQTNVKHWLKDSSQGQLTNYGSLRRTSGAARPAPTCLFTLIHVN